MFAKVACVAALAAAPVAVPSDSIAFVAYPGIYLVRCDEGSGTGFEVGRNHFLSVAHVTAMHNCTVAGVPITVTEQDGAHDFSQFDAEIADKHLRYSCEGFHAGEWVWAVGYAGGRPIQTAIPAYTTFAKNRDGFRVFIGEHAYIPGMSGGPVFNSRGEVVGTVNAYVPGTGISMSRDLRETSICKSGAGDPA